MFASSFLAVPALACLLVWTLVLFPAIVGWVRTSDDRVGLSALYLAGLAPTMAILVSPAAEHGDLVATPGHDLILRVAALGVYALIAATVVGAMIRETGVMGVAPRLMVGYGFVVVVSSTLQGQWQMKLLILPGLVFAACQAARLSLEKLVQHLRYIFRFTTLGSLFLLYSSEQQVTFTDNLRTFLGFAQLAGTTPHPNVLGPVSAMALAVELAKGKKRRSLLGICAAIACVALAQSRMGILAAVLVSALSILARWRQIPAVRLCVTALLSASGGLAFLIPLASLFFSWGIKVEEASNGRGGIWQIAWDRFLTSPLIGKGADAFSLEFRQSLGSLLGLIAGQAHNQLLQSLAVSGIIGAAVVTLWAVYSVRAAMNGWNSGSPLGAMLVLALLINFVTESPVRLGLTIQTFCVVVVAVAVQVSSRRSDEARPSVDTATPLVSVSRRG